MTGAQGDAGIDTVGKLLAHAYQMELEAQERYAYLADQMDLHNNAALAGLFRELSRIEGLHAADIREQMQGMEVPEIGQLDYQWSGSEGPETLDFGDMDYLMTSREALLLALKAEENAFEFFNTLLQSTDDEDVKRFASEFAEEEQEHVELVLKELAKYPEPEGPPRDDLDPPMGQD